MDGKSGRGRGRPRGSRNKATLQAKVVAAKTGELPLEYMLRVMRTSQDEKRRDAMAIAAAPFLHPRLSNSTVTTTIKRSVDEYTTAELIAALEQEGDASGAIEAQESLGEPDSVH